MAGLKTIGGDRLGSGKKMKVGMHAYEMSTHNLGYIFRSSGAFGTLIPFMSKVGLPNSTHDINLNTVIKTLPTIAPMFGSAKVQLDVFRVPMRLYIGQVHNNKLNIGNNMSVVKLPRLKIEGESVKQSLHDIIPVDVQQHDQSSLLAYLGIRGYGRGNGENEVLTRYFNAIPYLAYWDIYKCYYANKQEEIGMMIHSSASNKNNWYTLKNTCVS